MIPFGQPQETIDYLRSIAEQQPGAVVVFGDDGEKFGTWPETKKHVYDHGWLAQFFDLLAAQRELDQAHHARPKRVDNVPPLGKIYLPEGSYREMTEWVLPADQLAQYDRRRDASWSTIRAGRGLRGSSAAASGGTSR